jgi:glycine/D-amino acid oxidase-like deaminating enzyme
MDADVVVVGAGIVGCCAAAFLAEAGADVVLHERDAVAAGASGRNSGVLQDPLDPALRGWHAEALALHREVLDLPAEPDGLLLLGARSTDGLPPELAPQVVDAADVEPVCRPMPAVLLRTGWTIGPRAATEAWAARAQRAGARLVVGGERPAATRTLLCTGAWTAGVRPLWGVTARIGVRARVTLEEAGAERLAAGALQEVFSLVGDVLGSTFAPREPDPAAVAPRLAERAARFLREPAAPQAWRACPRPQAPEGVPRIARVGEATWVCAGHGAWGISIGPATARAAAELVLSG